MNISKDLDGILKNLWWVLEDLFKKTYGNTLALFISS
jgi:Rad3-related DNA helicase